MADSANDVPSRFDLVISDGTNTHGYVLYSAWSGGETSNAPDKAIHSYSPVFVPRTNIEGNFGDDSEDFFFTFSQNDWSAGEQQRNAVREGEGVNRYWTGSKVDVRFLGRVKIRQDLRSVDVGTQNVIALAPSQTKIFGVATDNLYSINAAGTVTDIGAHGLTGDPTSKWAIAADSSDVYMTDGSTGNVRKYNGSVFSTFSANGADSLCYHNNSLYGAGAGNLYRWSSAGARSTLFTWVDADGTAIPFFADTVGLVSLGGKLFISIGPFNGFMGSAWIYDGQGVSKIIEYPHNFEPTSVVIHEGIVFIGGYTDEGPAGHRPVVFYYASGTMGTLWRGETLDSNPPGTAITSWENGLLISDHASNTMLWYDSARGGVQTVASFTDNGFTFSTRMVSCSDFALLSQNDDILFQFPHSTSVASSATLTTSLIDFDSHLEKLFRGIKIEYDEGSDGDGGSVDIAYRVGDPDGSYTTLQTGAVSGTEYAIGGVGSEITGRTISVRLTLNKGTSTLGPVVKRIYVRAAPKITQRHRGLYHVDCTAPMNGDTASLAHDGVAIPRSGKDMVEELRDFASNGTLLTITDHLHSFTGVIERLDVNQIHANEDPGYVVALVCREV